MLKTLLKKQLLELNQSFFRNRKTGKTRSGSAVALSVAGFIFLMVVILGGLFGVMAVALLPMVEAGLAWVYFTIASIIALVLGVVGSVFNTYASLYRAKDNDLLLSLPVPVKYIMITRLLGVYLMGLMYSGVVMVPVVIVYCFSGYATAMGMVGSVLLTVMLSILVLTLSCFLGWVVAKISAKLKNKSLITVVVSLGLLAGYYYVYFKFINGLADILLFADTLAEKLRSAAYPLYVLGMAGAGDPVNLLIASGVILALFALTCYIMDRSFLKIATVSDTGVKTRYREKTAKVRSVDQALLSREFGRFAASPTYMLNCALGTVMMPICAVALIVKGREFIGMMSVLFLSTPGLLELIAVAVMCCIVSMNDISAPSVTLEGKSLWIAQSLPVDPWQVLRAKLKLHLLLTEIPCLLLGIAFVAVMQPEVVPGVLMLLIPLLYGVLTALVGLAVNLKVPNLNWTNETVAVKQSVGVLITLLGGWAVIVLLGVGYYFLVDLITPVWFMVILTVLLAAVCAGLTAWLKKRGTRIYASL
ncbi:MAG: hypothetical protein ACI3VZ_09125 [Faecousia sp.]